MCVCVCVCVSVSVRARMHVYFAQSVMFLKPVLLCTVYNFVTKSNNTVLLLVCLLVYLK